MIGRYSRPAHMYIVEMIGRYSRPAHMYTTNARTSYSGLPFLRDVVLRREVGSPYLVSM